MQTELLADFLRLHHCLYPARRGLVKLLQHFANQPRNVLAANPATLAACGLTNAQIKRLQQVADSDVDRDLDWLSRDGNHLICYLDTDYPELLRQIADFPVLLYASGQAPLLKQPQIAVVGSRHCTPGGAQNASDLAAEFAAAGITITSGMALGIDAAAHQGALAVGGSTIAVIGTGIDRIYPARHRKLAERIVENGLMVSEFVPGSVARPAHFPQRNRIISGLSMATVVVEAAQRSGSLITARFANEQGREVFALPGSIHNPQSRGCHQLIRDGANLAESAAEIINDSSSLFHFTCEQLTGGSATQQLPLDNEQLALLESIGYDPVDCDILVQRSGLTIDKLSSMLVTLELNDLIQSAPGGCFVRI